MKGPVTSHRESCLHYVRVLIAQSRAFSRRGNPFAWTLLEWAGNARRRYMAEIQQEPAGQLELFA